MQPVLDQLLQNTLQVLTANTQQQINFATVAGQEQTKQLIENPSSLAELAASVNGSALAARGAQPPIMPPTPTV